MKVTFNKSDVWNLDYTLSKTILKGLKRFKKSKRCGYPYDLENQEQWDVILDKMIYCFENYCKWDKGEDKFVIKRGKHAFEEIKTKNVVKLEKIESDTMYKMVTLRKEIVDKKGLNQHKRKVKEGFGLFFKYYDDLWD